VTGAEEPLDVPEPDELDEELDGCELDVPEPDELDEELDGCELGVLDPPSGSVYC
jgi:hypothetical protein